MDSLNLGSPKPVTHSLTIPLSADRLKETHGLDSVIGEDDLFMLGSFDNPLSISEDDD